MAGLGQITHPDLLVGTGTSDDAGVFRISPELALVQTVDFFTPVVDDPFDFGRIAAANALSDVYAMGGRPLTAMNIVCFPICDLPRPVLARTLAGGLEKLREAGCVLVGGHSVDDPEFKYGMAVTGTVHPDRILTNAGAREGDALILTKPLGTGVLATAIKGGLATRADIFTLVESASFLNRAAAETMEAFPVSACTDVTGFGLAGHVLEMARGSGREIEVALSAVPLLPNALEYASMGLLPAGAFANKKYAQPRVEFSGSPDPALADLLFDPQTSGGLVIALPGDRAPDLLAALSKAGVPASLVGRVRGTRAGGRLVVRA